MTLNIIGWQESSCTACSNHEVKRCEDHMTGFTWPFKVNHAVFCIMHSSTGGAVRFNPFSSITEVENEVGNPKLIKRQQNCAFHLFRDMTVMLSLYLTVYSFTCIALCELNTCLIYLNVNADKRITLILHHKSLLRYCTFIRFIAACEHYTNNLCLRLYAHMMLMDLAQNCFKVSVGMCSLQFVSFMLYVVTRH